MSDGLSDEKDRERKRGFKPTHTSGTTKEQQTVLSVASAYEQAAASAFAGRDDDSAHLFRDTADKLREMAKTLPPIPQRTR